MHSDENRAEPLLDPTVAPAEAEARRQALVQRDLIVGLEAESKSARAEAAYCREELIELRERLAQAEAELRFARTSIRSRSRIFFFKVSRKTRALLG